MIALICAIPRFALYKIIIARKLKNKHILLNPSTIYKQKNNTYKIGVTKVSVFYSLIDSSYLEYFIKKNGFKISSGNALFKNLLALAASRAPLYDDGTDTSIYDNC